MEEAHICLCCKEGFHDNTDLVLHHLSHIDDHKNYCFTCDISFNQKAYLLEHYIIHLADVPHKCTFCHRKYIQRYRFIKHYLAHLNEMKIERKPHCCNLKGSTQLETNPFDVDNIKKEIIDDPDESFTANDSVKEEVKQEHEASTSDEPAKKVIRCNICSKTFDNEYDLLSHDLAHKGLKTNFSSCSAEKSKRKRTIKCDLCNRQFSLKWKFSHHYLSHKRLAQCS